MTIRCFVSENLFTIFSVRQWGQANIKRSAKVECTQVHEHSQNQLHGA